MIDQVFAHPVWQAAGWTMLHFFWLGALLTALIAILRALLSFASPQVRYWMMLTGLGSMIIGFAVVVRVVWPSSLTNPAEPVGSWNHIGDAMLAVPSEPMLPPSSAAHTDHGVAANVAGASPHGFAKYWLADILRMLPLLWLIGTPLTAIWLMLGLLGVSRIRKRADVVQEGRLLGMCERLRTTLGVSRPVTLAACDRIAAPILIGILRPMILLPSAALTGWTPTHLEMALIHELAHVRRWDNLVNFLQRAIESALFFQPGVWLVSHWVREAREEACDAVVLRQTQHPEQYASLLVALATGFPPAAVPAATGMANRSITSRVRRILRADRERLQVSRATVTGMLTLAIVAIAAANIWSQAGAQQPAATENEALETNAALADNDAGEDNEAQTVAGKLRLLSLEQQRLADAIFRATGLDLEPLTPVALARLKAIGIEGGLVVADYAQRGGGGFGGGGFGSVRSGDILVGIHVWPTPDLESVSHILQQDDFVKLQPVKLHLWRPNESSEVIRVRQRLTGMRSPASDPVVNVQPIGSVDDTPYYAPVSPPGQAGLLFEGTPFEQWRQRWRTELSNTNRMECVAAMAAFGVTGRGREAVATILDVVEQYEWHSLSSEPDVKNSCIVALVGNRHFGDKIVMGYQIPTEQWVPVLEERLLSGSPKIKQFAGYVLPAASDKRLVIDLLVRFSEKPKWLEFAAMQLIQVDAAGTDERTSPILERYFKQAGEKATLRFFEIRRKQYEGHLPGAVVDRNLVERWLFRSSEELSQEADALLRHTVMIESLPSTRWRDLEGWLVDQVDNESLADQRRLAAAALIWSAKTRGAQRVSQRAGKAVEAFQATRESPATSSDN